jgi:hypothetical protein
VTKIFILKTQLKWKVEEEAGEPKNGGRRIGFERKLELRTSSGALRA